ncbi:MAG: hypothetical protein GX959_05565, partial [Clostridiales bacterium]|nr:hypothetical protein [Clostridiales bacterium]
EMVWSYLIEKATVNRDGSVSFLFRNGVEMRDRKDGFTYIGFWRASC